MIELDWDDAEKTIICYTFFDPWTWDEYYATNPKRDTMFAETNQVIDIILDFRKGSHLPPQAMTHIRKVGSWDSPKRGVVIVLGANSMLQLLANIMNSLFPLSVLKTPRPARDMQDALRLISEIRVKREQKASYVA
ncbi:MAG: hypothetical protein GC179_16055 [Anaerolineaceae bacterium]|nr:hypothetical protein [Anaerolineaceae bacterium]